MSKLKTLTIKTLYRHLVRPILFLQNPEMVHNHYTRIGHFLGRYQASKSAIRWLFDYQNSVLTQKILGMCFKNPIGLSAGFDKDANLTNIIPELGFSFMQIGTVTYKPYRGNQKPRLYRLPKSKGIVVNFGLKNIGVKKISQKLKQERKHKFVLSVSIGKTNSPETAAVCCGVEDYYLCLKELLEQDIGDFYTINISCPNMFGGEPFTTPKTLARLLKKLTNLKINKPIFLKMPINLIWNDFKKLLEKAIDFAIDGVIIGNLNKNHNDNAVLDKIPLYVKGGISGKPTWDLSNHLISKTYQNYHNKLIIIGVGGIFSAMDAYEKIKLGASLVQLITGMIYQGPQLIGEINNGLSKLLKQDGYSNIREAVGAYHRSKLH
jgi:dihydroorotate dehydrogenase subfamily 2